MQVRHSLRPSYRSLRENRGVVTRLLLWFPLAAGLSLGAASQQTAAEGAGHWPQWRGPNGDGLVESADPPWTWNETENIQWKVALDGRGKGTPVVWGDTMFLLTATALDRTMPVPDVIPEGTPNINDHPQVIESWKAQRFAVVCLDRLTGEPLWKRNVREAMPHQGHHRKGAFATQSAVTDGRYVYAYFGSFGLYCFDLQGRLVWEKDFGPQAMEDSLGEGSSPALFGNHLVIVVDQEAQSFVTALDARTGEELWRRNRDEMSNWSTPRILTHDGRQQVVVNGAVIHSYDLESGELLWTCGGHTASAIPVPAAGHGLVFTASGWKRDKLQAIRLGQRGDLTGGEHVVWSLDRGVPYVPSPLVWGEEMYLLEDQSFFSCVDARDGTSHYLKHRLPGILNFSASPVGAADRIYLLSEEGATVVVKRGHQPQVLAVNQLDDLFFASPVIIGGTIYLRGENHLYCITNLSP